MANLMPRNRRRGIAKCSNHPDVIAVGNINNDYGRTPTFYCQQCLDNGEHKKHPDHGLNRARANANVEVMKD